MTGSAEFAVLWADTEAGAGAATAKPLITPCLLNSCSIATTLHVPDDDQLLVVYSASPGTLEAESLALPRLVGTQQLTGKPAMEVATSNGTGG